MILYVICANIYCSTTVYIVVLLNIWKAWSKIRIALFLDINFPFSFRFLSINIYIWLIIEVLWRLHLSHIISLQNCIVIIQKFCHSVREWPSCICVFKISIWIIVFSLLIFWVCCLNILITIVNINEGFLIRLSMLISWYSLRYLFQFSVICKISLHW